MSRKLISVLLCGSLLFSILNYSTPIFASDEDYNKTTLANYISEETLDSINQEIQAFEASQKYTDYTQPVLSGIGYKGFNYLDGDILVTDSTSSSGLTGHVGIISGSYVIDINSKYSKYPAKMSLSTWFERYPSTTVIRYTHGRDIPVKAGWYAKSFYIDGPGSNETYLAGPNLLYSPNYEYCSSLVWNCYYKGAGFKFLVMGYEPSFIAPYHFINCRVENGFSAVYKTN